MPFPFRRNGFHMWQISRTHAGTLIYDGGDAWTQWILINAGCNRAAIREMLLFSVGAVRCCSPHRGRRGDWGNVKRNKWTTPINWLESPPSPCVCSFDPLALAQIDNTFPPQVHSGSFIPRRPPRGYWHHMVHRQQSLRSCRRRQLETSPSQKAGLLKAFSAWVFFFFFFFFMHALPVAMWLFSCFLPTIRRHANEGSLVAQNCP